MKKQTMKGTAAARIAAICFAAICITSISLATFTGCSKPSPTADVGAMMQNIRWFGQASVRIEADGKIIYIDPLYCDKTEKADLILITHLHADHYVYANVKGLMKKGTVVVAQSDLGLKNKILTPGQSAKFGGFQVEAVPAYNIVNVSSHPKADGNNGYVITIDGVRIYHAGDTELIPEMKTFAADIALVPLGQTFTFQSVDDAVQAVLDVKAKAAIPIHYGLYEGTKADALYFAEKLTTKGVTVEVRER